MFARSVPRLLTIDRKHTRKDISEQCLIMFKRNVQDFWRRFVTVDETWIHHHIPETKQQSKQWPFHRPSPLFFGLLKESSLLNICRKVKQSQGNIMRYFWAVRTKKCEWNVRNWQRKNPFSSRQRTGSHTSAVSMAKVHEGSNFWDPNLKIWLGVNRFSSGEEVIVAVDEYFEGFQTSYFSEGIKELKEHWTKCV